MVHLNNVENSISLIRKNFLTDVPSLASDPYKRHCPSPENS